MMMSPRFRSEVRSSIDLNFVITKPNFLRDLTPLKCIITRKIGIFGDCFAITNRIDIPDVEFFASVRRSIGAGLQRPRRFAGPARSGAAPVS
jgi:hypothetical protein